MSWQTMIVEGLPLLCITSPLVGILLVLVVCRRWPTWFRPLAIACASLTVGLTLICVSRFDPRPLDSAHREANAGVNWGGSGLTDPANKSLDSSTSFHRGFNVRLRFGFDGLTIWAALWCALATWIAIVIPGNHQCERTPSYYVTLFAAEACLIGSLSSRDAIVSLMLYELSLPSFFLAIGRWGSMSRRTTASRFLIHQMMGSTLTLLGITLIAASWPWVRSDFDNSRSPLNFATLELVEALRSMINRNEVAAQLWSDIAPWGFLILMAGLVVQFPVFPFHSWYARTLEDASPGVAGLVAIALPQWAFCQWCRFALPLFDEQAIQLSWIVGLVCSIGALHAGLRATIQRESASIAASLSAGWLAMAMLAMRLPSLEGLTGAWLLVQAQGLAVMGLFLSKDSTSDLSLTGVTPSRIGLAQWGATGALALAGSAGLFPVLSLLMRESGAFAACGIVASILLLTAVVTSIPLRSTKEIERHPRTSVTHQDLFLGLSEHSNTASEKFFDSHPHHTIVLLTLAAITTWLTLCPSYVLQTGTPTLMKLMK